MEHIIKGLRQLLSSYADRPPKRSKGERYRYSRRLTLPKMEKNLQFLALAQRAVLLLFQK